MNWELSLALKATVVLGSALVAVAGLRRTRASRRHLVLAAAFAALLVLPLAERLMPTVVVPVPLTTVARESSVFGFVTSAASPQETTRQTPDGSPMTRPWPSPWLVARAVWVVGCAGFVTALLGALWRLNRLKRAAEPWGAGQAIADALMKEMDHTRKVTVTLHPSTIGPATMGILRPTILLPREAMHWHVSDLQRVLIHEIEHTLRRDWSTHLAVRVVCIAYWFHPLAWIAWRQLTVLAERSCDDAVLARANRADYAEQLVTLAGQLRAAPRLTLSMAGSSALSIRVGAILNGRQARGRAGRLAVVLTIGSVAILAVSVASLRAVASDLTLETADVASRRVVVPAAPTVTDVARHTSEGTSRSSVASARAGTRISRNAAALQGRLTQEARDSTVLSPAGAPAPAQPDNASPAAYVQFVIGSGDVLAIAVWRYPDVSTEVVVRPDGKISVPLVNEIQAAGLTPERLRQTITAALGLYLENPSVTVQVKAVNSRQVFVVGQVAKPGAYPLNQSMTVIQLLAAAGGLTNFAKSNAVVIVREVGGSSVTIPFDYAAFVSGQQLNQNIALMPGDTVIVR